MTQQQQIAAFVDKHLTWLPRVPSYAWGAVAHPYPGAHPVHYPHASFQRPAVEELGGWLASQAEFKLLGLGSWLGTTDGKVIAEGVELVTPALYRWDVELLVEALRYAAQLQQEEGREVAGKVALATVAGAIVVGLGIRASGPSPRA